MCVYVCVCCPSDAICASVVVCQLRMQAVLMSRAVSTPSSRNTFYAFVIAYVEKLLNSSSDLLLFCSRVEAWPAAAELTEAGTIQRKQTVVGILQAGLGTLLLSGLTFVGKLGVHLEAFAAVITSLQQVRCAASRVVRCPCRCRTLSVFVSLVCFACCCCCCCWVIMMMMMMMMVVVVVVMIVITLISCSHGVSGVLGDVIRC